MVNENEHQLHITIPKPLYDEVKKIVPDYGAVSSLVRNLLRNFVSNYNTNIKESPIDKTVNDMVKDTIKKEGAIDGTKGPA